MPESQQNHSRNTTKSRQNHNRIMTETQYNHARITAETRHNHARITTETRHTHARITTETLHNQARITTESRQNHASITTQSRQNRASFAHSSLASDLVTRCDLAHKNIIHIYENQNQKCIARVEKMSDRLTYIDGEQNQQINRQAYQISTSCYPRPHKDCIIFVLAKETCIQQPNP